MDYVISNILMNIRKVYFMLSRVELEIMMMFNFIIIYSKNKSFRIWFDHTGEDWHPWCWEDDQQKTTFDVLG